MNSRRSPLFQSVLFVGQTPVVWMLASLFALAACSNGSPSLRQNSDPPKVSATGLTITELDTPGTLTGTCDDLGKFDRGFSLQLDGSNWIPQPTLNCSTGTFSIRVDELGLKMGFTPRKRATKTAIVRRASVTGKVTEFPIEVTYVPNVMPGGFAEGGGIATVPGKYILRGSLSGIQKETVLQSTAPSGGVPKFKMILNRDRGDQ